jgi:hypothetical protein
MRHEISGFEALRFGGASLGGKTLADGQSHAVVAEAFLSETLEINRMASPAPYQRNARTETLSPLYRMDPPGSDPALHVRRLLNDYAHANRRAPPGRNPGGGRKGKQD